ncbi:hypothetical protein Dda_2092 [Drechslerella dactyloides]|uniref:NmrA-like domain-containing protein n=1 Tax=Drechslerella dactyloides TaxID=74499 RepID=A0AAD6NNK9_DREDA|nr:hypothetical protein Dda_2092 [Drechslerella dactyloides]
MSSSSSTSSLSSLSSTASNEYKPKVALIGSGGLLGDATLTAFLSPAFSDYFAKPIRVFTRDIGQSPPGGGQATYVRVDWDDENIEDYLTRCLRGVSVVVNLLGYNPDAWDIVTRAVCRAKPVLYIPPEFSFDHTLWDPRRIPVGSVVWDKQRQSANARAAGVRTIQLFCGIIMENLTAGPARTGVDFARRRLLAVTGDGIIDPSTSISFTSSWDVGRAIAAMATMPASLMHGDFDSIYISGDTSSWSKLAKLMNVRPQVVDVSTFESRYVDRHSPLESYLRIAAAEGQLYFPSSQPSRKRVVALNQNGLVDSMARVPQAWFKLSMQPQDASCGPEASSSAPRKRKRGAINNTGSASDEGDAREHSPPHDPTAASTSASANEIKFTKANTATRKLKPRITKPRSLTTAAAETRTRTRAAATRATQQMRQLQPTSTTTQPEPAAVLQKRVTRSMTKRQTAAVSSISDPSADAIPGTASSEAVGENSTSDMAKTAVAAAASTRRRNTKRRRAG